MTKIGIICAMQEEIKELLAAMSEDEVHHLSGKDYHTGVLEGQPVVIVESGIGKVEAGITTEHLISEFGAKVVINSGSAGGIGDGLHVGDVVISTATAYHDVDARAFDYVYGQLPQQPATFPADTQWVNRLANAAEQTGLKTVRGLIVTGDQFVSSREAIAKIKHFFPQALAAEMEGAAVGQVANDHHVPYVVLRAMSDTGDEEAGVSFDKFILDAGKRSATMLMIMLKNLAKEE